MTIITQVRRIAPDAHRRFVADRLIALKAALREQVIAGSEEGTLRLATWNIMHFGDGGGYARTPESMLYIAEIISQFDLVAIQEVNRDLDALDTLVSRHLGPGWDYIVTDTAGVNKGRDTGNGERLAFLYRTARVQFCREAGEIVLPKGQEIAAPTQEEATRTVQFARTPFSVAFQAQWFKFRLCTVHIFYGDATENSPAMAQRRAEIAGIANFLAERQEVEEAALKAAARRKGWANPDEAGRDANYILLGDFNIVSPQHHTMEALKEAGFIVPTELEKTNLQGTHHYDQIAFKAADPRFRFLKSGVFDMFAHVYRDVDAPHYIDVVKPEIMAENNKGEVRDRDGQAAYFKNYYRKHQMSDHKLLWCALKVDFSEDYLDALRKAD